MMITFDFELSRYQNLTWRLPTVTKEDESGPKATALTLHETLFVANFNPVRQFQTLTIMSCCEPIETMYFKLGEKACTDTNY